MYTHIEGNIYSIFVPLPDNPLRNLNAYLIKDDKRSLLIDTGFRRDECREALLGGLAELGVSMDNTDICLTHLHSDHTGLAPEIAGPNSKIFMSREDSRRLREFQRSANTHRTEEYTLQGFSLDETAFLRMVGKFGADRVLFGTDSPWDDQESALARLRALPLESAELDAILGGNAQRLLGIA